MPFVEGKQQVARLDHADHLVQIPVTDREQAVGFALQQDADILAGVVDIDPGHLGARRHDGADGALGQRQHAGHHVALLLTKAHRRGGRGIQIVIRPVLIRLAPHQLEDGCGGALAQRLFGLVAHGAVLGQLVEKLDQHREADGRVEVALRNMEAEALRHQAETDHQQEAQAEHHHGRVGVDEAGQRLGGEHHHHHGDGHGGHHHAEVFHHADGGDDGVQREDRIQHQNLGDHHAKAGVGADRAIIVGLGLQPLVQLGGGLEQQEDTAPHQDEIATGEGVIPDMQNGGGEGDQPRHHAQEHQPHQQGEAKAEYARLVPLGGG